MKRSIALLIVATVMLGGLVTVKAANATKDEVKALVEQVAGEVEKDAAGTFKKITGGEHPYKNKDNPALYVFVYDTEVKIVAHPKKGLVGRSYKGKPDVRGKKFRDDIVSGALKNGTGWVDYSYQKPGDKGIHAKTTYYKLVKGNDGKQYVICAGTYKN